MAVRQVTSQLETRSLKLYKCIIMEKASTFYQEKDLVGAFSVIVHCYNFKTRFKL